MVAALAYAKAAARLHRAKIAATNCAMIAQRIMNVNTRINDAIDYDLLGVKKRLLTWDVHGTSVNGVTNYML